MGRSLKSTAPPPSHAPRGGQTPDEREAPGASRWRTPPSSRALRLGAGTRAGEEGLKGRWEALIGHQRRVNGQRIPDTHTPWATLFSDWKRGASRAGSRAPGGHCACARYPVLPCERLDLGPQNSQLDPELVRPARSGLESDHCALTAAFKRGSRGFSYLLLKLSNWEDP